jgi:hypothetical protein
MPITLATLAAEIRRISVQGHPGQKVCKTPFQPLKETQCVQILQVFAPIDYKGETVTLHRETNAPLWANN